jgi:hypothetical protein
MAFDFVARQKVTGLHLRKGTLLQLPVVDPRSVNPACITSVTQMAVSLTYTASDVAAFAHELMPAADCVAWDEDQRYLIRAEVDALFAFLYGLTRDELRYILDPTDIYGFDFPSETFRVRKEKEIRQFGEYRTARLVLAAWDRMAADGTFARWAP